MVNPDLEFMQERANQSGMVMGLLKVFVMIDASSAARGHEVLNELSAEVVELAAEAQHGAILACETEYAALEPGGAVADG
jgi:hypothetical protein